MADAEEDIPPTEAAEEAAEEEGADEPTAGEAEQGVAEGEVEEGDAEAPVPAAAASEAASPAASRPPTAGGGSNAGSKPGSQVGSRRPSKAPSRVSAEEVIEALGTEEKLNIAGYKKEELIEIFSEAIQKIDEKQKKANYCPVCTRRKLPMTPGESGAESVPNQRYDNGNMESENPEFSEEVEQKLMRREATEKKVEGWLKNRTDNKPFVEIDIRDRAYINDGFTRMFDKVVVDYRMNIIRGLCGRICVEYDIETGLATSLHADTDRWRFDWRSRVINSCNPVMILDEGMKERMVIALCREMKRSGSEAGLNKEEADVNKDQAGVNNESHRIEASPEKQFE